MARRAVLPCVFVEKLSKRAWATESNFDEVITLASVIKMSVLVHLWS